MTSSLPAQANLFALFDADLRVVDCVEAALRVGNEFADVWRPAEGWIAAALPLPNGPSDVLDARREGLAFAHGSEAIGSFPKVAELADQWPERLHEITGDFGFIRFRPHGGATVVRAANGLAPFYVRETATRVTIATLIGDIVRYDPTEPVIDEFTVAAWTSMYAVFPDGRSFIRGVEVVAPGHARIVGEGKGTVRYWDPRPARLARPSRTAHLERAHHLRQILVDALTHELDREGGNLLTLSGGVDSSVLGAMAAGVVGRPVWNLSLIPPEGNLRRERELSYIEPLIREFGFERSWMHPLDRRAEVANIGPASRGVFPVIHPALNYVRNELPDQGVRVLFGGEYADEFCGSAYTFPDWAMHVSPRTLLPLPDGSRDLLRIAKWRTLWAMRRPQLRYPTELPATIRADLRDEWCAWRRRHVREIARDRGTWPYRWAWWHHDGWIAMNWEALTSMGIRRSLPFLSRELMEMAYESHPVEIVGPGTKRLLRDAVAGDVPARNMNRTDKGSWPEAEDPGSNVDQSLPPDANALLDERKVRSTNLSVRDSTAIRVIAVTVDSARQRRATASSGARFSPSSSPAIPRREEARERPTDD